MKTRAIAMVEGHAAFTLNQSLEDLNHRLPENPRISKILDGQFIFFVKKLEDTSTDFRLKLCISRSRVQSTRTFSKESSKICRLLEIV